MTKTDKQNNLITGLVIGSTVGTIAGIFLASRRGKDTKVIVKKSLQALPELTEDLVTTAQRRGNQWSRLATKRLNNSLTRVQKAIAAGLEASRLEDNSL